MGLAMTQVLEQAVQLGWGWRADRLHVPKILNPMLLLKAGKHLASSSPLPVCEWLNEEHITKLFVDPSKG